MHLCVLEGTAFQGADRASHDHQGPGGVAGQGAVRDILLEDFENQLHRLVLGEPAPVLLLQSEDPDDLDGELLDPNVICSKGQGLDGIHRKNLQL